MIGKIKGKLLDIDGNTGLIETAGGISYLIFLTPTIISNNHLHADIELFTHLQVREDALTLFGFESKEQYSFFKLLLSVSGVGPKTAYSIISNANIHELYEAARSQQIDFFSRIPGVGKKTAMKIVLEISQKLKQDIDMGVFQVSDEDKTAIDALVSLGFKRHDARQIVGKMDKNLSVEEKITEALKQIPSSSKKL